MSLQDDVDRGIKSQQLLTNPTFIEGFQVVEKAIHEQWTACPLRDREGAHELKLMLKLLNDLKAVFELAVDDGKMAAMELKRLNEKVVSPKEFFGR